MLKTPSMTVDELAIIVNKAFIQQTEMIQKMFGKQNKKIDKRFDDVENRLDGLERQTKETNYRLIIIEKKQVNFELRLDRKMDKKD